jgi:hypothetical protein
LVTCPDDVTRVSGKAKKARNAKECPSSNKTLCESDFAGDGLADDFVRGFFVVAISWQSNQRIRSRQPRQLAAAVCEQNRIYRAMEIPHGNEGSEYLPQSTF